jgi:hypothetical protein
MAIARDVCGVCSPGCIVDQVNFKSPRVGTGRGVMENKHSTDAESLDILLLHRGSV